MDWTHLHLALNHVPVLGTPFLIGLLMWSWSRRQAMTLRLCLWLFVGLAAASIAIKFTGDFAAEKVGALSGFDSVLIQRHEEAADRATIGVFFMGVVAAATLFLGRGGRSVSQWSIGLLALLALATFALMVRTANFGGHIRHPEIRPEAARTP
jgi:uncharacterized membrane protein